ncbi:MAG: MBL fold metallo-hydrolase, partial [bacterium]|nr:MBL fold metallo-hydrolase [bacterium]
MKNCFILVLTLMLVLVTTVGLNAAPNDDITITILYDNYLHTEGTQNHWGFACLVEGTEKNILFDTGTKPEVLFHNMKKLNVYP